MLAVFCPGAKIAGMARVYVDRGELPDDLQALLDAGISPECTPPCDIFETSSGIEIRMDLPGVSTSEIEIVFAHNVLLIAGRKLPRACDDGNDACERSLAPERCARRERSNVLAALRRSLGPTFRHRDLLRSFASPTMHADT